MKRLAAFLMFSAILFMISDSVSAGTKPLRPLDITSIEKPSKPGPVPIRPAGPIRTR